MISTSSAQQNSALARLGLSTKAIERTLRTLGILGFALATAVGAQIEIPLPTTAVPITMQTLFVVLAGLALGARDGALSQLLYVLGGVAGLPLFAGGSIGLAKLMGPTGGYLVGFIGAAFVAGLFRETKSFLMLWAGSFLSTVVIFALGTIHLRNVLGLDWAQATAMGVAPFVAGDLIKVTASATLFRVGRAIQKGRRG